MEKNPLTLPAAIVIAGALIAGAVFYSTYQPKNNPPTDKINADVPGEINIKAVSASDHILGNPNAKLKIVEFSDTECPFCKTFHATMQQMVDKYGKTGEVAWIYRHFPLDSIHPKARKEAEATECVAELKGNGAFWNYLGNIFKTTPANNGLDPKVLYELAKTEGTDTTAFQTCLDSGKYASQVEAQYQDGLSVGVRGTPHSVIISEKAFSDQAISSAFAPYEKYRDPQTGELPVQVSSDKLKVSVSGAIPLAMFEATVLTLLGN